MKKFKNLKIIKINDSTKISTRFTKTSTLCTLSGGQDSILTFFLLLHSQPKSFLYIVYCHHFWQLKNFFSARLLFRLSFLVNVSYIVILPEKNVDNENDSRNWRKKNFFRVSQTENILTNLTGHTQTDILEKNLHNLFRGTSPAGCSGWTRVTSKNRTEIFFSQINLNSCFFYKLKKVQNSANSFPKTVFLEAFNEFGNYFLFENRKRKKDFGPVLLVKNRTEKLKKIANPFLKKKRLNQNLITKKYLVGTKMSEVPERKNFNYFKAKKPFLNELYFVSVPLREQNNSVQIPKTIKTLFLSKKSSTFLLNKTFLTNETRKRSSLECDSRKSSSFCLSTKFWNKNVKLLKPLEYFTRIQVSKILKLYKLPHLLDMTNFSSAFSRNKIRHQLIPFIRFLVHQKVDSLLIHFFQMLEEDYIERKKQIQELYFLCNLVNSKSRKNTLFSLHFIPILKHFGLHSFFGRIGFQSDFLLFENLKPRSLCLKDRINMIFNSSLKQKFVQVNRGLIKTLIRRISQPLTKSVTQKLFSDYKNLTLNYSQTRKLHQFY
uniref:tRNA(Ile)-lysidine synthase n=1 Tax=Micractinium sp. LBA 32 TaxID=1759591 RepID=A0A4Y6AAN0_9CHLO|nr:tRNA(Ile)-lysidine synthase [Micractinium sp. LBA 32]